ncbi:MAG TPA: hypothetical protein VFS11_10295 [Gemmatimonadales bacterium]|nr:hypothetical protein [Gemmatimonadales bacterium]
MRLNLPRLLARIMWARTQAPPEPTIPAARHPVRSPVPPTGPLHLPPAAMHATACATACVPLPRGHRAHGVDVLMVDEWRRAGVL